MALIKVTLRLRCTWDGFPPDYRVYVNDELFSDRTYNFQPSEFLEENIIVHADPGIYNVKVESNAIASFDILPIRIEFGLARELSDTSFEILNEETIPT